MVVGTNTRGCDVAVIGAGPGGYVAAIRLAQLGKDVLVVDSNPAPGGVCLNEGCIPSKALLHAAASYHKLRKLPDLGIEVGNTSIDFDKTMRWKDSTVKKLTGGIQHLFKKHGVTRIEGFAHFKDPNQLTVETKEGLLSVEYEQCVIATGSRPRSIPTLPFDKARVISSKEALELNRIPKTLTVVGAGVIGLEMGIAYGMLGADVHIVDLQTRLLPELLDPEISGILKSALEKKGIHFHLGHKVLGLGEEKLSIQGKDGRTTLSAEKVLVATGRIPNTEKLSLDRAGIKTTENGTIIVNDSMETNVSGIYAIGDITPGPGLAHKAYAQAQVVARHIIGESVGYEHQAIPSVIYTYPEVSTVGLTEEQAKKEGFNVQVGKFPQSASGRAIAQQATDGVSKVVVCQDTGQVLGAQIVAESAGELISEITLAIEMGAFNDDLIGVIHPHPTFSESIAEAFQQTKSMAVHL